MRFVQRFVLSAAMLLCACSTTDPGAGPNTLVDRVGAPATLDAIVDVSTMINPPDPTPQMTYANTWESDRQLYASLQGGLASVTMSTGGGLTATNLPPRVANWVQRIRNSGGQVVNCRQQEMGGWLSLIPILVPYMSQAVTWVMYRPAANYDAFVHTNGEGAVSSIVFRRRGAAESCMPGFARAEWA